MTSHTESDFESDLYDDEFSTSNDSSEDDKVEQSKPGPRSDTVEEREWK